MIRQAVIEDVDDISFIVQEWYRVSEIEEQSGICVDEKSLESVIGRMIRFPKYGVFVEVSKHGDVTGVVAGSITNWMLNPMQSIANELICFGRKEEALRDHFDRWANRMDIKTAIKLKPAFRDTDG